MAVCAVLEAWKPDTNGHTYQLFVSPVFGLVRQRAWSPFENPHGYCPNHATGVKLPDDFVVTPLQYVD